MSSDIDVSFWMNEAGRHPLLSPGAELGLAYRVQALQALLATNPKGPYTAEEKQTIRSGRRAKEQMLKANLRLVIHVARGFSNRVQRAGAALSFSDLLQEGALGLIRGIEKFDPTKGYKFSTYGHWWIRQGLTRAVERGQLIHVPTNALYGSWRVTQAKADLHAQLGVEPTFAQIAESLGEDPAALQASLDRVAKAKSLSSLDAPIGGGEDYQLLDLLHDADAELPMQAAERDHRSAQVQNALTFLTDQQRQLIEEHLLGGLALRQVAKDMNVSVDKAGALLRQGKRRLMLMLQELREEPALPQAEEPLLEALENLRLVAA